MICRPSLQIRLWLAALALAVLAMTAAAIAVYGLSRTQAQATEAMAAQRRIEVYGTYSSRVNDWMLTWLRQENNTPDSESVLATLNNMDRLISEDVSAASTEEEATRRARQSITPARLRGLFGQLEKTFESTPPGTQAGEAAIAFYAAQAPEVVAQQVDQEMRRRDLALAAMDGLRGPLLGAAIGIGIAAILVLGALYFLVLQPLFARLKQATQAAEEMVMGQMSASADGHDELGLMFARLRQMAMRISRRYTRLESIVSERTSSLSEANERLAHIDANRRRFFADVGHELRTPLTVIMGEAELGAASKDPETRASFATILTRAQRLFRRIEDILRIARSESGQLELNREPVPLEPITMAALADMGPVLRRAGINVGHSIPDLTVSADGDWLRQVFAGLLENAAKYAGRGAYVQINAEQAGDLVQIDVIDDGPGVPEQLQDQIFDRFIRDGANASGFGVGLALARWIVEALDGSLEIRPADKGLHLRLLLPVGGQM